MEKTKKCKGCQSDINLKARRCHNCQQDLRSWFARHPILSGVLGLIVFIVIISSFGGSSQKGIKQATTRGSVTTEGQLQVIKEYQEVINFSTSSNKNSDSFVLEGGKQKLVYKATGDFVMCIIYVLNEGTDLHVDGGIPDVLISEAGEDETILRKRAGTYYISVNTTQGCEVQLFEER